MPTRSLPPSSLSRFPVLGASALAALLALAAAGCASSSASAVPAAPPTAAADSGFLTDYSRLVASDQSPAVRFYRDDSRQGGYRRLYVRPVAVWRGAEGGAGEIPEDDLQFVADAFYKALERQLGQSFELVRAAGPDVLEIDIGFTLVPDPDGDIDHFTTSVPVADLAPRQGALPEATRLFLRDCLLEVEFRDIPVTAAGNAAEATGARPKKPKKAVRAAFVDARRGADSPKGTVATWADLDAVFEKWASALDERLVALRDGNFKPRLTAGGAAKRK